MKIILGLSRSLCEVFDIFRTESESLEISGENRILVTSCFAILGKKGKCLKTARIYNFEVTYNPKTPYGVKLNVLQEGYLRFLFWLPKPKIIISKIIFYKILNFQVLKNGRYASNLHTCKQHACKISKQYLFLAVQLSPSPKKVKVAMSFS